MQLGMPSGRFLLQIMTAVDSSAYWRQGEVAGNERRLRQYAERLPLYWETHKALIVQHPFHCVWTDNTVDAAPAVLDGVLPSTVERRFARDNEGGSKNKGAGLVAAWRRIDDLLVQTEWVVYVEGRAKILSDYFLRSFLSRPRSLFRDPKTNPFRSDGGWLQTSMFACRSAYIRRLAFGLPPSFADSQMSIERVFSQAFKRSNVTYDTIDRLDLEWDDVAHGRTFLM